MQAPPEQGAPLLSRHCVLAVQSAELLQFFTSLQTQLSPWPAHSLTACARIVLPFFAWRTVVSRQYCPEPQSLSAVHGFDACGVKLSAFQTRTPNAAAPELLGTIGGMQVDA